MGHRIDTKGGHLKKALFVTYGGGHISMVLPVIEALKTQTPDLTCVLLALTTGYAKAVAAGVSPLGYKDLLHLVDIDAAMHWGQRLLIGNSNPDVSEEESIAYLGINYLDLIAQHGEDGAAAVYAKEGRYGFRPLNFMRRLLDEIQPDVVIATNSPRSERAALEVAIQVGISNVGLMDLFGQEDDTYIHQIAKPDWTCVISESVKQRLVEHSFHPEGVTVTGNPAFDGLFSPVNLAKAATFVKNLGWQGLSPILWAGQIDSTSDTTSGKKCGHTFAEHVENTLRDFISIRKDLALAIRYHPSQWHTFHRLPNQDRVHFSVPSQEPIHPLILAAKAVVVQNSTVGLESAVAGKPVVSLEHSLAVKNSFSLASMGVSIPCYSTQELPAMLDKVFSENTVTPAQFASDGRAAERVARVITGALR